MGPVGRRHPIRDDLRPGRGPGTRTFMYASKEADTNPRARVGRDLLDLQGKAPRITINSPAAGTPEPGAITDPGQVASMLRMLLAGPVDQRIQPTAEQPGRLL